MRGGMQGVERSYARVDERMNEWAYERVYQRVFGHLQVRPNQSFLQLLLSAHIDHHSGRHTQLVRAHHERGLTHGGRCREGL